MTDLGYMVRQDWAQRGTAMRESSDRIAQWLGDSRLVFVVGKPERFDDPDRSADRETAIHIGRTANPRPVVSFDDLARLSERGDAGDIAAIALHPVGKPDCDKLREAVEAGRLGLVFVQVWARTDSVRAWLEGRGATDLHAGDAVPQLDPLRVAACGLMVDEEYNGLAAGRGKDAVVQLLRAMAAEGDPLDADEWIRCYFAAGGSFGEADAVARFAREVREGKRHRVSPRYHREIVGVLREQICARTNDQPE
ncbi:hypothetical protein [Lolliginicoccus levis]|uniref:hypothetical protein n=1 Tax=Lolliginicoccus levis TaxID=2919542 RepID=UPI00241E8234|nr:hypothetical protein [Lolliginicoccus levis]